jgi:hypothetical protein
MTVQPFKVCRNCGTFCGTRKRKCVTKYCRGTYFDPPTPEQIAEAEAKKTRIDTTIRKLLANREK